MAPALQLLLLASALAHGSWRVLAAEEGASTQEGAPEEGDDGEWGTQPMLGSDSSSDESETAVSDDGGSHACNV